MTPRFVLRLTVVDKQEHSPDVMSNFVDYAIDYDGEPNDPLDEVSALTKAIEFATRRIITVMKNL